MVNPIRRLRDSDRMTGLFGKTLQERPAPAAVAARPATRRFSKAIDSILDGVRAEFERLTAGGRPVIVGPFTGEVGFELLYWIPLLRWGLREFPELRSRVTYVSRGGVEPWIADLGVTYVDILSVSSPEEVLHHKVADKQRTSTQFEEELCRRAAASAALEDYAVLHPSVLYTMYYALLKCDIRAFGQAIEHDDAGEGTGLNAVYRMIDPPSPAEFGLSLPADFVAVRFYSRPSFPDVEANQRFAESVVTSIARQTDVVLLDPNVKVDEHSDFDVAEGGRVTSIAASVRPENNLALQSAVVARARAFVGTYGGLSYLAPHLGVPSLSFSSDPLAAHLWHYDLAQRVFAGPNWGSLVALRPDDLLLLGLVIPERSLP
jgi:hypothetical protein